MELQPFQKRVVEEKEQLDGKIFRLREFLATPSTEVSAIEMARLKTQLFYMDEYSRILGERIAALVNFLEQD